MQYIIDGYNLLHQTDFETRDQLVEALAHFCKANNKTAKIVFDGYADDVCASSRIDLVFAGDADLKIIQLLAEAKTPSFYTLVSSDRELALEGRSNKIEVIKSEDFDFSIKNKEGDSKDKELCFLSDDEVDKQLEEFNHFKS